MTDSSWESPDFPSYNGKRLDAFQQQAIAAISRHESVVVAAPTGAGKTLIAEFAVEQALQAGKRIIYTAPIKALSNQKYRDFSLAYPGRVGITTGDVSIRPDAQAVVMTTEIFRNTIFESPERLQDVDYVIYDEIHFMDDRERGTVWEESLIFAPDNIRVLALSATVSNLDEFCSWIAKVRPMAPLEVVVETHRPVPLEVFIADIDEGIRRYSPGGFERLPTRLRHARRRRITSIPERFAGAHRKLVEEIRSRRELPCLFFLFSRAACERLAEELARLDFFLSDERAREAALRAYDELLQLYQVDPKGGKAREMRHLLRYGVTYHHAGLLPVFKEIVEQLFAGGHVRMIFATETFAIGVNMPARAVAFEGLRKFDGRGRVPLQTRQYLQMAGRAGRRGLDEVGSVYVVYDPILDDPRMARGVLSGEVEPVRSQFNLGYATLLSLYKHLGSQIFHACEQSFANFLWEKHTDGRRVKKERRRGRKLAKGRNRDKRGPRRGDSEAAPSRGFASMIQQVQNKLDLLQELEYVRLDADDAAGRLTERGRFAALVYGRELAATELLFEGVLDQLSPEKLAVVFCALVHESRPDAMPTPTSAKSVLGAKTVRRIERIVEELQQLEKAHEVHDTSISIDWNLTGVVWAWTQGEEFDALGGYTNSSDGDIVRTLRQALQLLRMVGHPLKTDPDPMRPHLIKVGQRIGVAMDLLKRDLVDAEWQLRIREEELLSEGGAEEAPSVEVVEAPEADALRAAPQPDSGRWAKAELPQKGGLSAIARAAEARLGAPRRRR